MSNPLEDLKKLRRGVEKPRRKRAEKTDSVPMQDLGIDKIPDENELYDFFHKELRSGDQSTWEDNADSEDAPYNRTSGWAPYVGKVFDKRKLPDYRHGPVKVYTKEEIEEYEKQRDAKG